MNNSQDEGMLQDSRIDSESSYLEDSDLQTARGGSLISSARSLVSSVFKHMSSFHSADELPKIEVYNDNSAEALSDLVRDPAVKKQLGAYRDGFQLGREVGIDEGRSAGSTKAWKTGIIGAVLGGLGGAGVAEGIHKLGDDSK